MNLQVRIGQRIRHRREELGMTQQELAGKELTRGFISQLEKGIVMPSLKSLELIATRLYKPVSFFLEEESAGPWVGPAAQAAQKLEAAEGRLVEEQVEEARQLLAQAEAALTEVADPPARALGRLERLQGLVALREGELASAIAHLSEAVERLKAAGDPVELARAHHGLGLSFSASGRHQEAAEQHEEALKLLQRYPAPDPCFRLEVLTHLGMELAHTRNTARVVTVLEEAVRTAIRTGNHYRLGEVYLTLGGARLSSDDPSGAERYYRQALHYFEALGDTRLVGKTYHNLAALCRDRQDFPGAVEYLRRAVEAHEGSGDRAALSHSLAEMAQVLAEMGETEKALEYCRKAIPGVGGDSERARLYLLAGQLEQRLGHAVEARKSLEAAVQLSEQLGLTTELAAAYSSLGNLLRQQGEHALAGEYLARAVNLLAKAQGAQ